MRYALVAMLVLLCSVSPALAQVSIGIGVPSVSIGINLPTFPELVVVPDYPVYYAPRGDVNLFFYDGLYWAYERDNWYASSWYNGPWGLVGPDGVPAFVLRIPVRYYRHPPAAWAGWRFDAPPRWGERWGHEWEQRRSGWDRWDHRTARAPAPLPIYQREYSGNRYPQVAQQQALQREKYRYQPQEPIVRQHVQRQAAPQGQRSGPSEKGAGIQRPAPAPVPSPQEGPRGPRQKEQAPPAIAQHEQAAPKGHGQQDGPQGRGRSEGDRQPVQQGPEQERGQERGQEKGQGHNK
jgi:hypothetical protein